MIVNAEQALIGALMMEPRAIKDCGSIRSDMFADALLGRIYLEFLRAHDFGYQANLVTLAANIADVSQSELLSKLKACSDSSVTSTATGEYAEVIKNAYKARTATQIINVVQFHPSAVEKQIGETVNALEALQEDDRPKAKCLSEIVDEMAPGCFVDRERDFLYTGFPRLDDCLGGLEGGDIIVIGARPAVGKSAFVTQILTNMGIQGKRVLLYNLEMTNKQMYERLVSRQSGIMMNRIRQGKAFLGYEKERFQKANTELKRLDVWISSGVKSVGEIRRECQHMGADCIIIDYLQLIKAERHYANRASEVGDISKAIKSLAMELNRPIIVLSQLNRASEGRQTKEPTMSELRESGDIEQDASVVMLLWNLSEENERYKGVKVEKNRQGKTAKFQMEFVGEEMSFKEAEGKDFDFKPAKEKTPFD